MPATVRKTDCLDVGQYAQEHCARVEKERDGEGWLLLYAIPLRYQLQSSVTYIHGESATTIKRTSKTFLVLKQ